MDVTTLGEPRFTGPYRHVIDDAARVPSVIVRRVGEPEVPGTLFELAGPRRRLFFDPAATRAGIVTCGGLCPGLNNVIRSVFLELHHLYGVRDVFGFRNGYQGLDPASGLEPLRLTTDLVDRIHRTGGTVLGTSRGPVDTAAAVEGLARLGVRILFTVGGDGTQRGARELLRVARQRGHPLAVIGIPKTIDNDVAFVARSFGFQTAVEQAQRVLDCAHTEARSVDDGVSIVKLMGRHSGFIAAAATIASGDVNACLVPEVPFRLDGEGGLLPWLVDRLRTRRHAVIAVAEGAGQELVAQGPPARDASGNVRLSDIGRHLRGVIEAHAARVGMSITVRYFDPSYSIRSVPAGAEDSILCDLFARHAVHAAMAGKTGVVIGLVHDRYVHVPIELLVTEKKRLEPDGMLWRAVLAATGQPHRFE